MIKLQLLVKIHQTLLRQCIDLFELFNLMLIVINFNLKLIITFYLTSAFVYIKEINFIFLLKTKFITSFSLSYMKIEKNKDL